MFRKSLLTLPLLATALALPATPAHAATNDTVSLFPFDATDGGRGFMITHNSGAAEHIVIVGNVVSSAEPFATWPNMCTTPTPVNAVWTTTCTPTNRPLSGWVVEGGGGDDVIAVNTTGFANVMGNDGNDTIYAASQNSTVFAGGGPGNDTITLGHFVGSAEADGAGGQDTESTTQGGASLNGGDGPDTIHAFGNGAPGDQIDCGNPDGATDTVYADPSDTINHCTGDIVKFSAK